MKNDGMKELLDGLLEKAKVEIGKPSPDNYVLHQACALAERLRRRDIAKAELNLPDNKTFEMLVAWKPGKEVPELVRSPQPLAAAGMTETTLTFDQRLAKVNAIEESLTRIALTGTALLISQGRELLAMQIEKAGTWDAWLHEQENGLSMRPSKAYMVMGLARYCNESHENEVQILTLPPTAAYRLAGVKSPKNLKSAHPDKEEPSASQGDPDPVREDKAVNLAETCPDADAVIDGGLLQHCITTLGKMKSAKDEEEDVIGLQAVEDGLILSRTVDGISHQIYVRNPTKAVGVCSRSLKRLARCGIEDKAVGIKFPKDQSLIQMPAEVSLFSGAISDEHAKWINEHLGSGNPCAIIFVPESFRAAQEGDGSEPETETPDDSASPATDPPTTGVTVAENPLGSDSGAQHAHGLETVHG